MARSRRAFLDIVGSSALCLAISSLLPVPFLRSRARHAGFNEAMRDLFRWSESAAIVGSAYLRLFPQEAYVALLTRELLGGSADIDPDARSFARNLRRSICSDFRGERVVRIDGWVLSRTEARLCALIALTGSIREDQRRNGSG